MKCCVLDYIVLLCGFHRKQAWEQWLVTSTSNMRNVKEIAQVHLRNTAAASTEEDFEVALAALHSNSIWNAADNTWLPERKVKAINI